ncbi:MAG: YdiY family protein [Blastopirellula sp. JB062]
MTLISRIFSLLILLGSALVAVDASAQQASYAGGPAFDAPASQSVDVAAMFVDGEFAPATLCNFEYEPIPLPEAPDPEDGEIEAEAIAVPEYGYLGYVPGGAYVHIDYWLGDAEWDNSVELGINGQSGNTESLSLRSGAKIKREGAATKTIADIIYARTSNNGKRTQNNALSNAKIEWPFSNRRWHFYAKNGLEYDEFKDFDLRLWVSGGLGYQVVQTDDTKLTVELGSGFSKEYGSPDEEYKPEGAMTVMLDHDFNKRNSLEAKYEYYPEWEQFGEYRSITDVGYKILLDDEANLSLKFGLINRFDSTPGVDKKKNDVNYSVLLLWKL